MKTYQSLMSSTHVDLAGEAMSKEALEDGASQISELALPSLLEHDWRQYIGRVVGAEVVGLQDGHHALIGTVQVFEPSDSVPELDSQQVRLPDDAEVGLTVHGSSVRQMQTQARSMTQYFPGVPIRSAGRKSLLDSDLVTFGLGTVTLASTWVAKGFFTKAGADFYESIKSWLSTSMQRDENTNVCYEFSVLTREISLCNVRLFVHAADIANGSESLDEIWSKVNSLLPRLDLQTRQIGVVVLEYKDSQLATLQLVRKDGIPILMDSVPLVDGMSLGWSAGGSPGRGPNAG